MIGLRPYKNTDAATILSWCSDERAFYQWTAGMLGNYPLSEDEFQGVNALMPFTAFDESGIVGFFTLRKPNSETDELRFGFVIVDKKLRGKGYGKAMLQKGLQYVFEIYGAKKASLGVFENNPSAYHCYKAVGFHDPIDDENEVYHILDEDWKTVHLVIEK